MRAKIVAAPVGVDPAQRFGVVGRSCSGMVGPKLFWINRLRCVVTELETVSFVSARDSATHGRMAGKTDITTRFHPLALAFPSPRSQE